MIVYSCFHCRSDPERTISIERTFRFSSPKYYACVSGDAAGKPDLPPHPPPPSPGFLSVTVVGPDGRDPREAFPRRELPSALSPFRIPPGTIRR